MHINGRINKLEREANAKAHKNIEIEIYIADWCDCDDTCDKCKACSQLPFKEYKDGILIINVGAVRGNY